MAVNDKLNEQYKEQLKSVQALERFTKNITSEQKAQLKAEKAKLTTIEKRVAVEEAYFDSFDSFARDYKALGKDVQKQLTGQAKGSSSLVALNQQIAKEKKLETRYSQRTSDAAKAAGKTTKQRLEVLESINGNLTNQAKATQTAQDDLLGTSELTRELRDLEAHRGVLTNEQLKIAKKNLELKDQLKQKQEVLTELQKQQGDAMSMLPAGLQSAIGGARTLGSALKVGLGPLFVIGAILVATLKSFTDLEDSAKGFRETTGLTNSQMEGMRTQAIELQRNLGMAGVDAEKLFGTMSALTSEFSDIARFSDEVIGGLTLLNTNF